MIGHPYTIGAGPLFWSRSCSVASNVENTRANREARKKTRGKDCSGSGIQFKKTQAELSRAVEGITGGLDRIVLERVSVRRLGRHIGGRSERIVCGWGRVGGSSKWVAPLSGWRVGRSRLVERIGLIERCARWRSARRWRRPQAIVFHKH